MLDNPEQVAQLIEELKARQIEFAVFDVFNVLHASDENDNTQMRAVLRQLTMVQSQVGFATSEWFTISARQNIRDLRSA